MPIENEQVKSILETLRSRETGLRWMADEITAVIEQGKPGMREFQEGRSKRKKKAATTVPLDQREEMLVTLDTLKTYFCTSRKVWTQAKEIATKAVEATGRRAPDTTLSVVGVFDESGELIDLDQRELSTDLDLIEKLLGEAEIEETTSEVRS